MRGLFRDVGMKECSREEQWIEQYHLHGRGGKRDRETEGIRNRGSRMLQKLT